MRIPGTHHVSQSPLVWRLHRLDAPPRVVVEEVVVERESDRCEAPVADDLVHLAPDCHAPGPSPSVAPEQEAGADAGPSGPRPRYVTVPTGATPPGMVGNLLDVFA